MKRIYEIHDLQAYINWAYFYHAWQLHSTEQQQQSRAEAEQVLHQLDGRYRAYAIFQLFDANSDGDDIVLLQVGTQQPIARIPLLRQQSRDSEYLCLSDFVRPDRLAEATAEKLHEEVRRKDWGYAPDEQLTIEEQHAERFQGIRPAVGYPSLPDTSLNFLLDDILHFKQIGIRLTESGAMKPHASVSGMMIAHPQAHYFSIGRIGEDQLRDYACRRGIPAEILRKFLASNL